MADGLSITLGLASKTLQGNLETLTIGLKVKF
jgi:hypothetical protein